MRAPLRGRQAGFSLIEVLISVLILAVGLLGAAAIQLNALKFTDSSRMTSQASFVAYDMLDRIRANPNGSYVLANLTSAPSASNYTSPRDQDLYDFAQNIRNFDPLTGDGSIAVTGRVVTITVYWSDARAMNSTDAAASRRSFVLTSRVAIDASIP
ncbi:type IV pilus modification protein PilV [Pseudomonas sp. HR96]|uniref:type IV pilus modification protein PilV n=1 Tax=Pseudomonas sp. HR96 TaxID=1027966 RepID=UPI0039BE5EC2